MNRFCRISMGVGAVGGAPAPPPGRGAAPGR
jgi:hypothetical protein